MPRCIANAYPHLVGIDLAAAGDEYRVPVPVEAPVIASAQVFSSTPPDFWDGARFGR